MKKEEKYNIKRMKEKRLKKKKQGDNKESRLHKFSP
jgi:hypothetical protein